MNNLLKKVFDINLIEPISKIFTENKLTKEQTATTEIPSQSNIYFIIY